jgi:hypothetical protein
MAQSEDKTAKQDDGKQEAKEREGKWDKVGSFLYVSSCYSMPSDAIHAWSCHAACACCHTPAIHSFAHQSINPAHQPPPSNHARVN